MFKIEYYNNELKTKCNGSIRKSYRGIRWKTYKDDKTHKTMLFNTVEEAEAYIEYRNKLYKEMFPDSTCTFTRRIVEA